MNCSTSYGLNLSSRYTYRVAAYDSAGNTSVQSASVSQTTQPLPSAAFTIGQRVLTTGKANVRSAPSGSGSVAGTQPRGALGGVTGGLWYWNQQWCWKTDFDTGVDGWVTEGKLKKAP